MDVDNTRVHGPNLAYRRGGTVSHDEVGVGRSPIVSRRGVSARRGEGTIGQRLRGGQRREDSLLPPLFEVHFEMNPRDPDYDSKIYLAIDQASEGQRAGDSKQRWCGVAGMVVLHSRALDRKLHCTCGAPEWSCCSLSLPVLCTGYACH